MANLTTSQHGVQVLPQDNQFFIRQYVDRSPWESLPMNHIYCVINRAVRGQFVAVLPVVYGLELPVLPWNILNRCPVHFNLTTQLIIKSHGS